MHMQKPACPLAALAAGIPRTNCAPWLAAFGRDDDGRCLGRGLASLGGRGKTLSTVTVKASAESEPQGYLATRARVGKVMQDPHRCCRR